MDAVPDGVGLGDVAGESNCHGFETLGLAHSTGKLAVLFLILPTDVLHMSAISNAAICVRQLYVHALKPLGLSRSAGNSAITNPRLQAEILNMGTIGDLNRLFHRNRDLETRRTLVVGVTSPSEAKLVLSWVTNAL